MTTLTLHIENSTQDAAIRTLLDALHVKYDEVNDMDETEYLNSSAVNAERLKKSIDQIKKVRK
jgi:hypothetical protein